MKKIICLGVVGAFLCGCQSMENLLSDSGMRQDSQQDVVVNPVPRTKVPAAQDTMRSKIPAANTGATSPQPQPAAITPAQSSKSSNAQSVVPNVAPSLGE